jgi:hypothetical protein
MFKKEGLESLDRLNVAQERTRDWHWNRDFFE